MTVPLMKLGKKPVKHDPRTLHLRAYLKAEALPPIPAAISYSDKVGNYPMYQNDVIGDCAIAGPAHQIQTWSANDGEEITPTEDQVLEGYQRVGGWNPADPSSDNGCVLLDVMNHWRREGICGRKIAAYAKINDNDINMLKAGIFMFGGVMLGVNLPAAVQEADSWTLPSHIPLRQRASWQPGTWGGHCVPVTGFKDDYLEFISWGRVMRMNLDFAAMFIDEGYVAVATEWLGPDLRAPNGLELTTLLKDLSRLA